MKGFALLFISRCDLCSFNNAAVIFFCSSLAYYTFFLFFWYVIKSDFFSSILALSLFDNLVLAYLQSTEAKVDVNAVIKNASHQSDTNLRLFSYRVSLEVKSL
jgi:hypothetical protein